MARGMTARSVVLLAGLQLPSGKWRIPLYTEEDTDSGGNEEVGHAFAGEAKRAEPRRGAGVIWVVGIIFSSLLFD